MLKPVSAVIKTKPVPSLNLLKPFTVKALRFFLNKILKLVFILLKSKYGSNNNTWYGKSYLYTSTSTVK